MDQTLVAFVAVTSIAVVLQMLILAGMYFSMRKTTRRMEALSTRVEEQVLPLVEKVRGLVDESAPMIRTVVTNVTETSGLVRSQVGRIDETVTEVSEIVRTQAQRADQLATRTMQRIDITAGVLQQTVTTPSRRISALLDGVMAGVHEFAIGRKARREKDPGEMPF